MSDDVCQVSKQAVKRDEIEAGVLRLLLVKQSQLLQVFVRGAVVGSNVLIVCQNCEEVGDGIDQMREAGHVRGLEVEVLESVAGCR